MLGQARRRRRVALLSPELLYEIEVNDRIPKVSRGEPGFRPAHSEGIIRQILHNMIQIGALTDIEGKNIITNSKL